MNLKWFALVILLPQIITTKKHTIYFLNINTTNNPIYIKRCDIVIKPGNKSLDIDFHVARDLANDLRASVAFASSMSGKQAGQAPELRFDLPLCEIMNNGLISKSTLITNWGKSFFKQGSLPAKCPILAGYYTWRDLTPRQEHLPTSILSGVYRIYIRLYTKAAVPGLHSSAKFLEKGGRISIIIASCTFHFR